MKAQREDTFRRFLLVGALVSWMVAISITLGVALGVLEVLVGWGLIANMSLALAVTITVIWAQFRIRRVIIGAFNAGMKIQQDLDAAKRSEDR